MLIKNTKGLYTIKVDTDRRISYETPVGLWTKEDYLQYHNEYVTKVAPLLGTKPWAKCVDTRNYKTSNVGEEMNMHVEWMIANGAACAAVIVESSIVKMQINRAVGGKFPQQAFTDEVEADAWLKSKGF